MNFATLIALATQAAQLVAAGEQALDTIRAIVARDQPDSLQAFDAAVAAARKPWQDAASSAAAENAGTVPAREE